MRGAHLHGLPAEADMTTVEQEQTTYEHRDEIGEIKHCHLYGVDAHAAYCGYPVELHMSSRWDGKTETCPGCGRPICKTCIELAPKRRTP
jgi:hypothetical protein